MRNSSKTPASTLCLAALLAFCIMMSGIPVSAEPSPGDVFREYHLVHGGSNGQQDADWLDDFVYVSDHKGHRGSIGNRSIFDVDLDQAIKAEIVVSHWGGHIGSENRQIIINECAPIPLPLIRNTPTRPECYFSQQCQAACPVPLDNLKPGENQFRLEVGDQICYSFNWGWFWTNQVILRVYYKAGKVEHPLGEIEQPVSGDHIQPFDKIVCKIHRGDIERVEFIGKYRDFSWGGSGDFTAWHGVFFKDDTRIQRNIGTATGRYPYVNWNCRWIPDQDNIRIAARLVDTSGMIYMTEAVDNVSLSHGDRIVKLYPAADVPECFATQTGTASCRIPIPDDLDKAFSARLVMSTFSGGTADREVLLNDVPISLGGWGEWHRLAFCEEAVPVGVLKKGDNIFTIKADLPGEHAFEVNWPGPVLLVEFDR